MNYWISRRILKQRWKNPADDPEMAVNSLSVEKLDIAAHSQKLFAPAAKAPKLKPRWIVHGLCEDGMLYSSLEVLSLTQGFEDALILEVASENKELAIGYLLGNRFKFIEVAPYYNVEGTQLADSADIMHNLRLLDDAKIVGFSNSKGRLSLIVSGTEKFHKDI